MAERSSLTNALSDRYEIEREAGAGGMATVYLARDIRHARQVALEVLHPDLAAALGPDRFLAEIRSEMKRALLALTLVATSSCTSVATLRPTPATAADDVMPLAIGETFTMPSRALGERRRINVYQPPGYSDSTATRFPVLYMPDGGLGEDFLHVAGLLQVSVGNGTMRPFILVGIENTERRRDMTGPTTIESDRRIAAQVGGSAAFRAFIRSELMPRIRDRYRTTAETAIVGESLAGLFVVETFFTEPDLFDTYIAFDPSLWWNDHQLVKSASERLRTLPASGKTLYLANGGDAGLEDDVRLLTAGLATAEPRGLHWFHDAMPSETHATIYHPAALRAFRTLFKPRR